MHLILLVPPLPGKFRVILAKFNARSVKAGCRPSRMLCKMLYSAFKMPVVFIVSREWDLRGAVRAELRQMGVEALGMETVGDMAEIIARGIAPSVVVLDGAELQNTETYRALEHLTSRMPFLVVDSRLDPAPPLPGAKTVLKPVQIKEIVSLVLAMFSQQSAS